MVRVLFRTMTVGLNVWFARAGLHEPRSPISTGLLCTSGHSLQTCTTLFFFNETPVSESQWVSNVCIYTWSADAYAHCSSHEYTPLGSCRSGKPPELCLVATRSVNYDPCFYFWKCRAHWTRSSHCTELHSSCHSRKWIAALDASKNIAVLPHITFSRKDSYLICKYCSILFL